MKPWPRRPLLTLLMRQPVACRFLTFLLLAHFSLMQLGLNGWSCPFLLATQRPCPGCGLSRSVLMCARGNLQEALSFHAFGPLSAISIGLLILSAFLPHDSRERLTTQVERFEIATGASHLALLFFFLYWAMRMVAGHGTIPALA